MKVFAETTLTPQALRAEVVKKELVIAIRADLAE
jgi:hypothetical protein